MSDNKDPIDLDNIEEDYYVCLTCKGPLPYANAFCPRCGGIEDETYEINVGMQINVAKNVYEKSGGRGVPLSEGVLVKIEDMLNKKFEKFIDPIYIKMFSRFIISTMLYKAVWKDGLGVVRPNLFCFMIGDSGVRKSPILNKVDDITSKVTKNIVKTHKFTPSFLLEEARQWKHQHPKPKYIFPVLTERDEMTTLIKEGGDKNGFYGEMPEFLCESYDGWIKESDSKMDRREGIKHERHRVYHTFIGASTPTFLNLASDDSWWEGGLFNRPLWAYVTDIDEITPEDAKRVMADDIDPIDQYITSQLKVIESYEEVTIVEEALSLWHDFIADINNYHLRNRSIYSTYCLKQIHVAIKLSIISAASRGSMVEIDVNGVKSSKLVVEKIDMEWAINDMMTVWFVQAGKVISRWQEMKDPVRFQNEKRNIDKIRHCIQSEMDRYTEIRRETEDGRLILYLRSNPDGDWVYYKNVLSRSHLLSRIFQGYQDTLEGMHEIEVGYATRIGEKNCIRPIKMLRSISPKVEFIEDVEDKNFNDALSGLLL